MKRYDFTIFIIHKSFAKHLLLFTLSPQLTMNHLHLFIIGGSTISKAITILNNLSTGFFDLYQFVQIRFISIYKHHLQQLIIF
jgi:hypothetical protein